MRRLNRAGDSIKNDKLVNSIIKGGINIFKEIKKLRGHGATCSSRIDGEVGSITPGKRANFLITKEISGLEVIPYRLNDAVVDKVYVNGDCWVG